MKPSRVESVLTRLIRLRWPAFIWGPPGVGKSAVVKKIASALGLSLRDVRAALLDPTDLRGIPAVIDGKAVWCPPSFLPSDSEPSGLLFLDEINAAPPLVQASLYQLVLDRQIGEYRLPDGWRIVAAGNRQTDRSVVFRLSSALANRFTHIQFEADFDDWRAWALSSHIEPTVIGFLALRPQLLLGEPGEGPAYPTPRTWEMASDVIGVSEGIAQCADVLPGVIGEGAAAEFLGYARTALREDDFRRIAADPKAAKLPNSLSDAFALTAWLAYRASEPTIRTAGAVLLTRLPVEFAVILARDLVRASAEFLKEPGYRDFARKHGKLLTG